MLPAQVISYSQLRQEGLSPSGIAKLSASLRLFPTPFKGIYYSPLGEERQSWTIQRPLKVLSMALQLYLRGSPFYFSGASALEAAGLNWTPTGRVHIMNIRRSGRINLQGRIERNARKANFRSSKIATLLSFYGRELVFHRASSLASAKIRRTPYGDFATPAQVKKDLKMKPGRRKV